MPVSETILPVLIGADMNCYTLARAFHEAYGVRSYAFGRWAMGDTMYSRLVRFTAVPDIDSADTLLRTVTDFAAAHADKTLIVMGCTDDYASLLMDVRDKLPANCIAPYITPELRDKLVSKADFYALCDKYGIPYPKTFCAEGPMDAAALSPEALGFAYPVIVKPSSSILYWKHPFDGMKKVYAAATPDRTSYILGQSAENPFDIMAADAARLVTFGADVIAIPCNTAHYFYDRLNETIPIPILNMVEETVLAAKAGGSARVGILATTGTVRTRTYQRMCEKHGLPCAVPDDAAQAAVMDVIYGDIKQGRPADMAAFERAAASLRAQGCDRAILGCTELSLIKRDEGLGAFYLDSMEVLARNAILAFGKTPIGFD